MPRGRPVPAVRWTRVLWFCSFLFWVCGLVSICVFVRSVELEAYNQSRSVPEGTDILTADATMWLRIIGLVTIALWWRMVAIEYRDRRYWHASIALLSVMTALLAIQYLLDPFLSVRGLAYAFIELPGGGCINPYPYSYEIRPWYTTCFWVCVVQFVACISLFCLTLHRWRRHAALT
jgi:hypothetical protein